MIIAASFNKFYGKMWNGFCLQCLNTGKQNPHPRRDFILKPIEGPYFPLKKLC